MTSRRPQMTSNLEINDRSLEYVRSAFQWYTSLYFSAKLKVWPAVDLQWGQIWKLVTDPYCTFAQLSNDKDHFILVQSWRFDIQLTSNNLRSGNQLQILNLHPLRVAMIPITLLEYNFEDLTSRWPLMTSDPEINDRSLKYILSAFQWYIYHSILV